MSGFEVGCMAEAKWVGETRQAALPFEPGAAAPDNPFEPRGFRSTEARLRILLAASATTASSVSMLDACRSIGRVICEELGWDFLGVWTLQAGTWVLRCT